MNKNVFLLACCQGLMTTGNILLVTISALVGQKLSASDTLITLPIATQMLGLLLATVPASLVMAKTGRKLGFSMGNLIGTSGAILGYLALINSQFYLFCLATFLIGIGIGFATLYRFAAIEVSDKPARAISMIMASGVIAAVLGPNLAVWVNHYLPEINFANSFLALTCVYLLALTLLQLVAFNEVSDQQSLLQQRPIKLIITQPQFMIAAFIGMISYSVMNLLMTATPLAMHRHGFELADSALVIEWHVLGMFLPSFFTGKLVEKYTPVVVIMIGCLLMLGCAIINLLGVSHWHFLIALFLLGVGWNFMFISATSLVSETYRPHERAKAQASNEFVVFSMVVLSSLFAGWLESKIGWQALNVWSIPVVLLAFIASVWFRRRSPLLPIADKP
ncbi:major facilitator transporter [Pseudoalteromonas luteoviolacea]|uniref:Major facilitator transporter n=1 Tax=Pseudoalteromonas luteoviolacea TaxID=43657 RepID=A0A0C1QHV0_9GAMM|nr:MFS transporter [Pseudoalteromonas luteoviolacea]KID54777.1 major facilitator transporter [Pseudoalteromonas luteoviolacea]